MFIKILIVIFVVGSTIKMWQNWRQFKAKMRKYKQSLYDAWKLATKNNFRKMQQDMIDGSFRKTHIQGISASEFGNRNFTLYMKQTDDGVIIEDDESFDNDEKQPQLGTG